MPTATLEETPQPTARRLPDDLSHCARLLQAAVGSLNLTRPYLLQLIGGATQDRIEALDVLLGSGREARRNAIREVLTKLEDRLDVELGSDQLQGWATRTGRHLASALGAALGIACCYLVVGGLLEGDSLMLGDSSGPAGLGLFGLVLAILATFEALHVSAAILKIADLGALAEKHPRAAALHRRFHTDDGLARFLAGRQLVVVGTVFLCSSLSSFPGMETLPFTDVSIPPFFHPFLAIGLPGALFVLWFGQLAPQFIATRHAVQLTDTRLAGLAFRLAYGIEAAGLARVGFWASAWDKATEKIPFSAALRWRQAAEEVDGVGVVGVVRDWRAGSNGYELRATTTLRVYQAGLASLTDGSMLVPGVPSQLQLDAEGSRADGEHIGLMPTDHREEILPTGDRCFHKPLVRAIGSYRRGDTLRVNLTAQYSEQVWHDVVHVEHPMRFVSFLVTPEAVPQTMRPATLRSFHVGDDLGDLTELASEAIEPVIGPDGISMIDHVIDFPAPHTLFILDWELTA
jgi:hypothetical protein